MAITLDMYNDAKIIHENIFSYSGQISNLQVKTDNENIPGHPDDQPGSVLQGENKREREESERQTRSDGSLLEN